MKTMRRFLILLKALHPYKYQFSAFIYLNLSIDAFHTFIAVTIALYLDFIEKMV